MIPRGLALVLLLVVGLAAPAPAQLVKPNSVQFERFIADLWKDAQAQGILRGTFVRAFDGVTPDRRVIATTKKQPEYNKPAGAYVNQIASAGNAAEGRKKELQWRPTFEAIENKYRVERWLILAIWGMETSYGTLKD
jgi:membrane-bound lytic murein transglycosylase B